MNQYTMFILLNKLVIDGKYEIAVNTFEKYLEYKIQKFQVVNVVSKTFAIARLGFEALLNQVLKEFTKF